MKDWNQSSVDSKTLQEKLKIVQTILPHQDHEMAYLQFADKFDVPINEIVYYLNAYEEGGESGLKAIHKPDIIPEDIAQRTIAKIKKVFKASFPESFKFRVTDEGTAIAVYEIQKEFDDEGEYLRPGFQLRLTLENGWWHVYWRRKFEVWWPYVSDDTTRTHSLTEVLEMVIADKHGCFWG
jgi:hypothetical protein